MERRRTCYFPQAMGTKYLYIQQTTIQISSRTAIYREAYEVQHKSRDRLGSVAKKARARARQCIKITSDIGQKIHVVPIVYPSQGDWPVGNTR